MGNLPLPGWVEDWPLPHVLLSILGQLGEKQENHEYSGKENPTNPWPYIWWEKDTAVWWMGWP